MSAPSGTGKTTLVERLVHRVPNLCLSRSYTSRAARPASRTALTIISSAASGSRRWPDEGDFLEWADVFGNYYGTCAADTERCLAGGQDLVLVIDVQGARQVRSSGIESIGIFVLPPSAATLEQRLRGRSKDSEEEIRKRLDAACREVTEFATYEYVVVNDELGRRGRSAARDRAGRAGAREGDAPGGRNDHRDVPS